MASHVDRLMLLGFALSTTFFLQAAQPSPESIPLPEHPRPDFAREQWINLNGPWAFGFDKSNQGEQEGWPGNPQALTHRILVPFPWGSPLSGVKDEAPIAWYHRSIRVPAEWKDKRVFLVVGASDWLTSAWLDGQPLGQHRGGYTPFEFELTPSLKFGADQSLVLRVDDSPHPFKLEGKQGYGPARGIWQTIYLEARPKRFIRSLQFYPDIDHSRVRVKASFSGVGKAGNKFKLQFNQEATGLAESVISVPQGESPVEFDVNIPNVRLWSLEDPFLYEVKAILEEEESEDKVSAYFGMRKVSVEKLPGSGFPYIALNNRPIYLQMTLDQAYHPEGYYTFPTDAFMRDEILRSRRIGLNAMRIHVKIEHPRKLYWADRLGMLIMADVPNSWGEPNSEMRQEIETAMRGMIKRDFNHPAIFSWVIFNETWGLVTKDKGYTPETQEWVASVFKLAKSLDPTRLVEDNSPCNYDHVVTDINTWHQYLPGYQWRNHLDEVTRNTYPGSKWNYIGGRTQGNEPLLNSECGNVWGYEGSAGDVDWSWDYHLMMNEFRRHPKICGWLYTEHHDVINEWNGYWRYDRSEKFTGLEELVPGMTLRDWHGPYFLAVGEALCQDAKPEEKVTVPVWASFLTDNYHGNSLLMKSRLYGWDELGRKQEIKQFVQPLKYRAWTSEELPPMKIQMPATAGLYILAVELEDEAGSVLHRNFTTFRVGGENPSQDITIEEDGSRIRLLRFSPKSFAAAQWSSKQWDVLDGLKVNGAGYGYFEYRLPWPEGLQASDVAEAFFKAELSAKQLFGKDREGAAKQEGDFMRGLGTHDPSLNRNAYPMTDTQYFPSLVRIQVSGQPVGTFDLPDDPADHRGILSWHSQKKDRFLREAGSYGYLVSASLPPSVLKAAAKQKQIVIRLEVDSSLAGGLAIYGDRFGRYPLDPTVGFVLKK